MTIPVVLFLLQRSGGYLAGSKVDWISQHAVFPEYFRELFYKTGNMFPQFAAETGGGQNIYNYAYYGLCNPLYWISYLLPTVKMTDYIQVLSLLGEMANGVLCYWWLGRHFEKKYSFFGALMLMLALPVIYHSSAQIMFVNYMPFLILTFIGYDRYCRTSKYGLMVGSIIMMILTSFYFAVGGLAALFLYAMSGWKREQASSFAVLVKCFWHQFYPVLLGGFLSMFYLVPVYCAMRQGRSGSSSVKLKELLIPDVSLDKFLYSPYGLGLAATAVIAVCTSLFYEKTREKWLGIFLAAAVSFPVFTWILNGGLYIRDKALIPLIPVICFIFAGFLQRLGKKELRGITAAAGYVFAVVMLLLGAVDVTEERYALYIELAVCGAALLISLRLWRQAAALTTVLIMLAVGLFQLKTARDGQVTEQFVEELNHVQTVQTLKGILQEDGSLYRMEVRGDSEYNKANQNRVLAAGQNLTTSYSSVNNAFYHSFRSGLGLSKSTRNSLMEDTVDNPVFLRFMGVKYLVGQAENTGYEKVEGENAAVYKNEKAAPLFYLTNQTITETQFDKLSWARQQLALLENAVAGDTDGEISAETREVEAEFGASGDGVLAIDSQKAVTKTIYLNRAAQEGEYLFLSFSIKNIDKHKDVSVTVNGQKNKLSGSGRVYYNNNEVFHYTCAVPAGTDEITVEFGAGHYEISDIRCWLGSEDEEKNESLYQNSLDLSRIKSGDGYEGSFESSTDGWLITSVPYDKNFHIYVDGEQVESQMVNKAFLGARLTAGQHDILIIYEAPGRRMGLWLSIATGVVMLGDCLRKRRKKNESINVKI